MTPLTVQLACAQRELALRHSAYPRWVAAGKMKQSKADEEIEAMRAIVKTLERQVLLDEISAEMRGTLWDEKTVNYSQTTTSPPVTNLSTVQTTKTKEPPLPEQESLF